LLAERFVREHDSLSHETGALRLHPPIIAAHAG
jgi:hypothetical protein